MADSVPLREVLDELLPEDTAEREALWILLVADGQIPEVPPWTR